MATVQKGNRSFSELSLQNALTVAISFLVNHNPQTDPVITVAATTIQNRPTRKRRRPLVNGVEGRINPEAAMRTEGISQEECLALS